MYDDVINQNSKYFAGSTAIMFQRRYYEHLRARYPWSHKYLTQTIVLFALGGVFVIRHATTASSLRKRGYGIVSTVPVDPYTDSRMDPPGENPKGQRRAPGFCVL